MSTTETPESRARAIRGALTVLKRQAGPVWYGVWRDSTRKRQMKRLGAAWLVERPPVANPFVDGDQGRRTDDEPAQEAWRESWEKKRGRCPDTHLTQQDAAAALRQAIVDRESAIDREQDEQEEITQGGPVLFGAVADAWLVERQADVDDEHLKKSTLKDYRSMLRRKSDAVRTRGREATAWIRSTFDDKPVGEITAADVDAFEKAMRDAKLSPRTRIKYLTVLSMILDYAVHQKHIAANPMAARPRSKKGRKRKPQVQIYEFATVEDIAGKTDMSIVAEMIRVAALTGLRQGELLALRWSNVDFAARSITVAKTYGGAEVEEDVPKSGAARTVPMSDQAGAVFDRISKRDQFTRPGDLVFCNNVGEHTDASTVRREYGKARDVVIAKAAKKNTILPKLTFHALRHSFGSACAAAGVPLSTIQRWMGHESITTTMVYVHWQPRHDDADRLTRAQAVGSAAEAATAAAAG